MTQGKRAASDLLPCPFCGREPYIAKPSFQGGGWQIGCYCGEDDSGEVDTELGACWRDGDTFEEAAQRWNGRPTEEPAT